MSKCLAIKTGENTLEPTAQTNNTLNAIKLALLQKQAEQNFAPNDEIWITESGDFTVPYDGVYEVLCIAGGDGAWCLTNSNGLLDGYSGASGNRASKLIKLQAGQNIEITIGAGGLHSLVYPFPSTLHGGITYFGTLASSQDLGSNKFASQYVSQTETFSAMRLAGGGMGGGFPVFTTTSENPDGRFYGAGGGLYFSKSVGVSVGNGHAGAVHLRFFNPEKASLPTINDTDLIPYLTLLQRLDNLEKQFAENVVYNDEIVITESGNFEVPVTGDYEVTCIGGGQGGVISASQFSSGYYRGACQPGANGSIVKKLVRLTKGESVNVVIGSGGSFVTPIHAMTGWGEEYKLSYGGETSFGDITTASIARDQQIIWYSFQTTSPDYTEILSNPQPRLAYKPLFYGTGGTAKLNTYTQGSAAYGGTDGTDGAVILRFHNPNKNQGV